MKLTLDPPGLAGAAGSVPPSVRIRERLMSAGHRFHANDNIATHLRDGEDGEDGESHIVSSVTRGVFLTAPSLRCVSCAAARSPRRMNVKQYEEALA